MALALLLEKHRQAHAQSTMNLCIFSFQSALLVILLVQYHYIIEVDAEKVPKYPNGNWFNSVEKKIEIVQEKMKEAYEQFIQKANDVLANSRIFMGKDVTTRPMYNKDTLNEKYNEGFKIDALFQSYEENKDPLASYDETGATSEEKNDADPEKETLVVMEQAPKRKKKIIKRHKKRSKPKHEQRDHLKNEREHIQLEREHIQHEREHIQPEREHTPHEREHIQPEREHIQHERHEYVTHEQREYATHVPHEYITYEQREYVTHVPHEYVTHVPHEYITHEQHEYITHVPHEQRLDASIEQEKEEYNGKRVLRKDHKKREKLERFNQRKFVKTYTKESNSSESDEVKRRKPVDIIVHIKMND